MNKFSHLSFGRHNGSDAYYLTRNFVFFFLFGKIPRHGNELNPNRHRLKNFRREEFFGVWCVSVCVCVQEKKRVKNRVCVPNAAKNGAKRKKAAAQSGRNVTDVNIFTRLSAAGNGKPPSHTHTAYIYHSTKSKCLN